MKRIIICLLAVLPWICFTQVMAIEVTISPEEQKLYDLIMQYRAEKNLPSIPLSASLTKVAQVHAKDVYYYYDEIPSGCNPHSWSGHGNWQKCDYYPDHRNAAGMWSKPKEITSYQGNGYEIVHYYLPPTSGTCTAEGSLRGWQHSSGHNAVIINLGIWSSTKWQAIGIGMYKGVACVWFGKETDPDPSKVTVYVPQTQVQPQAQTQVQPQTQTQPQVQQKPQPQPQPQPKLQPEKRSWLQRYFDYSGFSSLSYFSAGYMYSCMGGNHLVNVSLLDFRASLFSASLLNAEMSVSPFNKRFAYKPNIRIYIPIHKCMALVPYGGAEIDASYIAQYLDNNYPAYNVDNDFYINAIGGVAFNTTVARHVPLEIKVEYRHPVLVPTAGALNPQGIYLGAQIYFGSVFSK